MPFSRNEALLPECGHLMRRVRESYERICLMPRAAASRRHCVLITPRDDAHELTCAVREAPPVRAEAARQRCEEFIMLTRGKDRRGVP